MKVIFCLLVFSGFSSTLNGQEISLEEAYQAALKVEDYELQNRSIKGQARALVQQARSGLFPKVSLTGQLRESRFTEDESEAKTSNQQKTLGINLRQPLFQGGLIAGLDRQSAVKDISDLQVKKNDLDLYLVVADNYYRITLLSSTLDVLNEIDKVSSSRVKVLRQRVNIGRSKQSDFLTNQLQNQEIKIQIGQLTAQLEAEQQRFARLTGLSAKSNLVKKEEVPSLQPLDHYLSKVNQTPDVQMQAKSLLIAEKSVSMARAQHLPSLYVDLDAKYGEFSRNQEGKEYSALLSLQMPIFEGGRVNAEVQAARWKRFEERAKLDAINKNLILEIKNQYDLLAKNIELFRIHEDSLDTARKNYQFFNKELELGLVSNLELLNSLNSYLNAKKNREEAFLQLKLVQLNLNKLVGEKR